MIQSDFSGKMPSNTSNLIAITGFGTVIAVSLRK
jgi:hypothetical protein